MEYYCSLVVCASLSWALVLCQSDLPEQRSSGCVVPPYSVSLHEVNVTAESERLLLTEGRCYLACLSDASFYRVSQLAINLIMVLWCDNNFTESQTSEQFLQHLAFS